MKTGIISAKAIAASPDLQLGAAHYLCPTAEVDRRIARLRAIIEGGQKRLAKALEERQRILAEHLKD